MCMPSAYTCGVFLYKDKIADKAILMIGVAAVKDTRVKTSSLLRQLDH